MKHILIFAFSVLVLFYAKLNAQNKPADKNRKLNSLFAAYYEEGLKLKPLEATDNGDNRYNNLLPPIFTDSYRTLLRNYYSHYLGAISKFNEENLSVEDKLSYAILKHDLEINLEGLKFKDNLVPFSQEGGLPSLIAQLGGGNVQPFKTLKDYEDWIQRATLFSVWSDSAIVYFRKGIVEKIVLPQALVKVMISQMEEYVANGVTKSIFYNPIKKFPEQFNDEDKKRLTSAYIKLINEQLFPSYKKLRDFLNNEYLPMARTTSGLNGLPGGDSIYRYYCKFYTTTNKTPEEIYNKGLTEVTRITSEIEKLKDEAGFKGDLNAFIADTTGLYAFLPHYKTEEDVFNGYKSLVLKITPALNKIFFHVPKTAPEMQKADSNFSSNSYYAAGSGDGRPGIFFISIYKPEYTALVESLFMHEVIPGHHYQQMLQRENKELRKFRRFISYEAFQEGWALYAETLGKQLGFYTDRRQRLNALFSELFRAARLVVDVGLHEKGWPREQAIQYMKDVLYTNMTAEVERYMAVPGQALAYKIGSLEIQELRNKYATEFESSFNLATFHDELLKDGPMPLDILVQKMDNWAKTQLK